MPHVAFCGNRCHLKLSSDDVALPSACGVALRVAWATLVAIILAASVPARPSLASAGTGPQNPCDQGLVAYLSVSLGLFCLSIVLELLLLRESSRGTMIQVEQRAAVPMLLLLHATNTLAEFVCSVFGCLLLWHRATYACTSDLLYDSHQASILLAAVVVSQLIDTGVLACCCCLLRSRGSTRAFKSASYPADQESPLTEEWAVNKWLRRHRWVVKLARCFSCGLTGGSNVFRPSAKGEGEQVARMLTHFFHHGGFLDLTPSDVLVGLLLVRLQQRVALRLAATETAPRENGRGDGNGDGDVEQGVCQLSSNDQVPTCLPSSSFKTQSSVPFNTCNPIADSIPPPPVKDVNDKGRVVPALGEQPGLSSSSSPLDSPPLSSTASPPFPTSPPSPTLSAASFSTVEHKRRSMKSASRRLLPEAQPGAQQQADEELLQDLAHGAWYTWAVYSYFMYLFSFPVTGYCGLAYASVLSLWLRCCDPSTRRGAQMEEVAAETRQVPFQTTMGMGCCGAVHHSLNVGAVQFMLRKIGRPKLLFASFKNGIKQVPYSVHDDAAKGWVVISIRGTWSIEDALVDSLFWPTELDSAGSRWGFDGKGKYAHQGFLEAALLLRSELDESGVLAPFEEELSICGVPTLNTSRNKKPRRLVIIGHSMGAAVGALLALCLRARYPSVQCIGYGMPGSVCCELTVEDMAESVTSVVCGKDAVPRISFHTLLLLRAEVLDAISRAKVNKGKILRALCNDASRDLEADVRDFLHPPGEAPDSAFKTTFDAYCRGFDDKMAQLPLLFMPGRIVHYVKHNEWNEITGARAAERAAHAHNDDKQQVHLAAPGQYTPLETHWQAYLEILVSPTMMVDHMPASYLKATAGPLPKGATA